MWIVEPLNYRVGADCQLVSWKLVSPCRWYAPHELSYCRIHL